MKRGRGGGRSGPAIEGLFGQAFGEALAPAVAGGICPGAGGAAELVYPGGGAWACRWGGCSGCPGRGWVVEKVHVPGDLAGCADGSGDGFAGEVIGIVEVGGARIGNEAGGAGSGGLGVAPDHGKPDDGGGDAGGGMGGQEGGDDTGAEEAGFSGGGEEGDEAVGGGVRVEPGGEWLEAGDERDGRCRLGNRIGKAAGTAVAESAWGPFGGEDFGGDRYPVPVEVGAAGGLGGAAGLAAVGDHGGLWQSIGPILVLET